MTRPAPGTGYVFTSFKQRLVLIIRCRIKVQWKDAKGNLIKTTEANEGDDLLSIAHEYDIDLEGALQVPNFVLYSCLTLF